MRPSGRGTTKGRAATLPARSADARNSLVARATFIEARANPKSGFLDITPTMKAPREPRLSHASGYWIPFARVTVRSPTFHVSPTFRAIAGRQNGLVIPCGTGSVIRHT